MSYLTIEFHNKTYEIEKTSHASEAREGSIQVRDSGITKQGYESILLQAFKYGLNSFKNSLVVITFNDYTQRRISMLVEHLGETITIISVFRNWDIDDFKANYITVKNRINLTHHWSLPEPGEPGNKYLRKSVTFIQPKKIKNKNQLRIVKRKEK